MWGLDDDGKSLEKENKKGKKKLKFLNNLNNNKWCDADVLVIKLDDVTLYLSRHHLIK